MTSTIIEAVEAAQTLAIMLDDPMLAEHLGGKLTCIEAERFAAFVGAWVAPEVAETWLDMHAVEDDEGDDHYERGRKLLVENL